eukprot:NODE_606_length_6171_cov_0.294466.p2 type:complete len:201 gc:universal NODE_606_length_6171_cov_0.294466:4456-3854(-)
MAEVSKPINVLQVLRADHVYSTNLSESLTNSTETSEKNKFKNSLVRHLSRSLVAEEMVVYPIMKDLLSNAPMKKDVRDALNTLQEAHTQIKSDLCNLDSMVPIQPDFSRTLAQMMELLNTVDSREEELIKEMSDVSYCTGNGVNPLNDPSYADDYLTAKESAPTRPHPSEKQANPLIQAAECACTAPIDKLRDYSREFAD